MAKRIWAHTCSHVFFLFFFIFETVSVMTYHSAPVLLFFNSYFVISLTLTCCHDSVENETLKRTKEVVACTSQRKCWSASMTAERVGVNHGSLNPINLPVIQLWQVSLIIQHKGQNKWVLHRQGAYCSLCPWQSQNKWPQAYRSNRFTLGI